MKKIILILSIIINLNTFSQNILTYAGNGNVGYSGDGGQATNAQINMTNGLKFDDNGNLYIADQFNHVIRKVDTDGVITTIAGNGISGFSGDGGLAVNAQIASPIGVAIDNLGNIYFCDYLNQRIRKINSEGIISTIAGNGVAGFSGDGTSAASAQINLPQGITSDDSGNIYFADRANNRIRKISSNGIISTYAGTGIEGFSGDGSAATSAQINYPIHPTIDQNGNLFFCDAVNQRVRKIDANGIISTIAGNGIAGFTGDGANAASAQINSPQGLEIDSQGNLYIADNANNRIRKINSNGIISTIAGNGVAGFTGDGALAVNAQINYPRGVAIKNDGGIYFGDGNNFRIRAIQSTSDLVENQQHQLSVSSFPNPFSLNTTIEFHLTKTAQVRLEIYDFFGTKVSDLIDKNLSSGMYTTIFNAEKLPNGVYVSKLVVDGKTVFGKLVLMR